MESTLREQARVLGSSPDSATHLLCDLGQVTGLSKIRLLICLMRKLGHIITNVPAALMCSDLCCLSQLPSAKDSHTPSFPA